MESLAELLSDYNRARIELARLLKINERNLRDK